MYFVITRLHITETINLSPLHKVYAQFLEESAWNEMIYSPMYALKVCYGTGSSKLGILKNKKRRTSNFLWKKTIIEKRSRYIYTPCKSLEKNVSINIISSIMEETISVRRKTKVPINTRNFISGA